MDVSCEQLDAYLNGDLRPADAHDFEMHANSCPSCREAVDEQRWIDGLLRSAERFALESPRPSLIGEIEAADAQARQRSGMLTYGLAAAAVVLLAVGWILFADRGPEEVGSTIAKESNELPNLVTDGFVSDSTEQRRTATAPRAVVDGGSDMLVVPVESPYPDVTIVRMYPIYKPDLATNSPAQQPVENVFHWPESL